MSNKAKSLPAWQVILRMVRFRPWFWLIDLVSVLVVRVGWWMLLVFDDLSSALDVETERTLWERLFGSASEPTGTGRTGPTCLVVSHRRAALRRADQIVVLEGGRVADTGTLDELLERNAAFRELWYGKEEPDRSAAEGVP